MGGIIPGIMCLLFLCLCLWFCGFGVWFVCLSYCWVFWCAFVYFADFWYCVILVVADLGFVC